MSKFTLAILFFSLTTHAQLANLPDLSGRTEIGRVVLYQSVQPLSWLQTTAFSPEFSCTQNNTGDSRACSIKILNQLDEMEKREIERLTKNQNLGVVGFSDLDSRVVEGIQEEFSDTPADLSGSAILPQSLRLSYGLAPYASYAFRAKKDRVSELTEQYQNEGLGIFRSRFRVHTQRTLTYLAFRNGQCLKETLATAGDKYLARSETASLASKAIAECDFKYLNYDEIEAPHSVRVHLRDRFFSYSWFNGYQLIPSSLSEIKQSYVVTLSQTPPSTLDCEVTLLLRAGARPETKCLESEAQ